MIADLGPYAEYKEPGVPWLGQVPEHWAIVRAKAVYSCIDRRSTTGKEPLLTVSSARGVVPRTSVAVTMFKAASYVGHKLCWPDDLVINSLWAWAGGLGVSKYHGIVSTAYSVYRIRPAAPALPAFLHYFLRSAPFHYELQLRSKGIWISRLQLTDSSFLAAPLPLPPLPEQASIVRFLDWATRRVDRAIQAKRRLVALLNEQKQAIIHRAVTQGLDPSVPMKASGIPWLGEIPAHWEVRRIGAFARVGNGSTPARSNPSYWRGGHYPWLNSSQVHRGVIGSADQFVTTRALAECHLPRLSHGAVLIAITGQGKTRGTAAILAMDATINQHIAYIIPSRSIVSSAYLQAYLQASYVALRAMSEDAGSTKGAITCRDLKSFGIAVPPMSQQAAIVAHLDGATAGINSTIARTQRQIGLLREYRARLVADVVTGKLDVRAFAATLPDEVPDDIEAIEADVDEDADDDETGDGADEG